MPRALLILLLCSGCIAVDVDGIDGFSGSSAAWAVLVDGNSRTHRLVLSSVAGWCKKKQQAELDRSDAFDRYEERGLEECESTDEWLEDVKDAYAPLDRRGASHLTLALARAGELDPDASSVPGPGTFEQVGSGGDGTFAGSIQQLEGSPAAERADAYTCEENTDGLDVLDMLSDGEEAAQDVQQVYHLDAGEAVIEEAGEDKWRVELSADLVQGDDSVGSIETTFTAERCEIVVN